MLDTATQRSFAKRFAIIRTLEKKNLLSAGKKARSDIRQAGRNCFFEYQNNTYFVNDINRYEETSEDFKISQGYFIYELTCTCIETGKTVYFEWEEDDELEIAMTIENLSFRDLTDDEGQGIDEDDLDQIADDRDVIMAGKEQFLYEDDWASIYHRQNRQEKVYVYEFENREHTRFLTIEEWQGSGRDEYRIYISVPVDPDSIAILSTGEI
jgi:hypothetical protein